MKAKDVRYWFEVHSKCRLKDDSADVFEWYFEDVDIVRFCDEIATHATHERLQEDVAWECEGEGKQEANQFLLWLSDDKERRIDSTSVRIWKEGAKQPRILVRIFDEIDIDGELVQVIVRRKGCNESTKADSGEQR